MTAVGAHEPGCRLSFATAEVVTDMNPLTFVRCRVLGTHRWERVGEDLDSGRRCRDCGEEVLTRYFVEGDHGEPEPSSPYYGKRQPPKP
jgi:hypothetical protein